MKYDLPPELVVRADGPIRTVVLNNPDQRNAATGLLHEALISVWRQLADDVDCRVVILTGAGEAFCAGGDMSSFERSHSDADYRRRLLRDARRLADEMLGFHKPIIGAINGAAVGLGATLAFLCDIVLMADTAFVADTHVTVGVVAGDGGIAALPYMTSILRAKEFLFTGERIYAAEAAQIGLANRAVPAAELMTAATELAGRIAKQPRQALEDTKRAINLHLQQAATLVLPFALAAESESFTGDDVVRTVKKFKGSR